jgi:hypothetical protein
MPRWWKDYEKANEPGFGYCTGQLPGTYSAHWVYGAEAGTFFSVGRNPA